MSYGSPEVYGFAPIFADTSWPDLQLCISPNTFDLSAQMKSEANAGRPDTRPGITITGLYLRPKSRGSVSIRSSRFSDPPTIRANWLVEPEDQQALIASVKFIRQLVAQPALRPFVGEETKPGVAVGTDNEILEKFRFLLSSGLHGTGTCRMGRPDNSVVDSRLCVHGVTNLRVVDCSAMPTTISGNTNASAMALALRAAQLILEDRDNI
jgi:choline dehydrogenase